MDLRGAGLVRGTDRLRAIRKQIFNKYGARIKFDSSASFGRIDELTGTIHLNPDTATFDILAHELSHVRFANALGKWKTGKELSNFEVNLMEAIGYWGTYNKGISCGLTHSESISNSLFGPAFAQQAIQALKSGSPNVRNSFELAIKIYGREYVEQALRFRGLGMKASKDLPIP